MALRATVQWCTLFSLYAGVVWAGGEAPAPSASPTAAEEATVGASAGATDAASAPSAVSASPTAPAATAPPAPASASTAAPASANSAAPATPTAAPAASQQAPVKQTAANEGADETGQMALGLLDEFSGRNGLGINIGLTSGIGISYRRYIVDQFALRGVGYIFYQKEWGGIGSLGLQGQYDLRRDSDFVFYGLVGIGMAVFQPEGNLATRLEASSTFSGLGAKMANFVETRSGTYVFPGIGAGLDLGNHDEQAFTYQLELMLTLLAGSGSQTRLLPLPQLGFYFNF